jgi:phage host-nuclease inhibitor protein Gam
MVATTPKRNPAVSSREDADQVMLKAGQAKFSLDGLMADLNADLAEVRSRYELQLQAYGAEFEAAEKLLKDWAKRNADLAGDSRTIELVHGAIEFRTGTPAVKTVSGVTEEEALARLQASAGHLVRRVAEIDRETIIANRDSISAESLAELGLRIVQTERIHVCPKIEEAP